jgi:hypothetical protein
MFNECGEGFAPHCDPLHDACGGCTCE